MPVLCPAMGGGGRLPREAPLFLSLWLGGTRWPVSKGKARTSVSRRGPPGVTVDRSGRPWCRENTGIVWNLPSFTLCLSRIQGAPFTFSISGLPRWSSG